MKSKKITHSEQEPIDLEHKWAEAYVKADMTALDRLLGDEYVFTGPFGNVMTKGPHLSDIRTGHFKILSAEASDMNVLIYGDTAVVRGINTIKAKYGQMDISGKTRFTNVIVYRDGRWQVVTAHNSIIADRRPA
jgi:ketosteroid isomerase-like protein